MEVYEVELCSGQHGPLVRRPGPRAQDLGTLIVPCKELTGQEEKVEKKMFSRGFRSSNNIQASTVQVDRPTRAQEMPTNKDKE